jgi:hypothetical protein|tara:strand:- start:157 stop:330 length:174 start_codon:yes stop_codon:yes gene_type:complete
MMTVEDAVEVLSTTYQSLDAVAQGMVVDVEELEDAIAAAEADSVEAVCLKVLSKYNT